MILVDSNVLIDLSTGSSAWLEWSERQLTAALEAGPVLINPIVYGEVSADFDRTERLDDALAALGMIKVALPFEASFLAAKVLLAYRRAGGPRTTMLPDFLIGAHAAVAELKLLTRDPRRYRTYFPTVELIAPD